MEDEREFYLMIPDTDGSRKFGLLLKHLRLRNELRTNDLADKCGITTAYIKMIENGARVPSMELAQTLLHCMDNNFGIYWGHDERWDLKLRAGENGPWIEFKFVSRIKSMRKTNKTITDNEDFSSEVRLRMECIEIAQQNKSLTTDEIIERAREFEAYVKGEVAK